MIRSNSFFMIAVLLCLSLTLFLFQPGYMDHDSADQFAQSQAGTYSDWHPPAMSWVWSLVGQIAPGASGMFALQALLYWGGLGLLIGLAEPHLTRRLLYLIFGFFPPAFMLLATVLKDVWMAGIFLSGTACILFTERGKSLGWFAAGCLLLGYGMLIRHNAIAAAVPLFLYAGFVFARRLPNFMPRPSLLWRSALFGSLGFVTLLSIGRAWSASITDIKQYPQQQIMLHDLVGMSLKLKTYLVPPYIAVSEQPSMRDLRHIYNPRALKNLYWPDFTNIHYRILEDPELAGDLTSTWARTVIEYPRAYLWQRASVFSGVMNFTNQRACGLYYYEETIYKPKGFYQPDGKYYSDRAPTDLLFIWVEPLRGSPLYLNWLYPALNALLFGAALAVLLSSRSAGKPLVKTALALSASGTLYGLAYFFVATACDFRMVYWNVIVTVAASLLVFIGTRPRLPSETAA